MSNWNFFTNHGHIIILLGRDPGLTLREISQKVGITERATQKIIGDLEKDGFVKISKVGRNNQYKIAGKKKLRHSIERSCSVDSLIGLINNT